MKRLRHMGACKEKPEAPVAAKMSALSFTTSAWDKEGRKGSGPKKVTRNGRGDAAAMRKRSLASRARLARMSSLQLLAK